MAIVTKTIGELKEHCFFVPSYQRGYHWTDYEVTALLDDVNEFSTEGNKQYCIQPLIVKQRDGGTFEVVDGQQRLTTIYIFMKIARQEIRSAIPPYDLEFETRIDSAEFLRSLSDDAEMDEDLYYALKGNETPNFAVFKSYWDKISALFADNKPKHGHLLRQALFTFGDYTLSVDNYKTLCVDDPREGKNTPSLKQLFSRCGEIVKRLLDTIDVDADIDEQLKTLVKNSDVPQNDWRYCFIQYPALFGLMSLSHLRMRYDKRWLDSRAKPKVLWKK